MVQSENPYIREIQEMQKSVHHLQIRVKELSHDNHVLKTQLQELQNADIQLSEQGDRGDNLDLFENQ